MDYDLKLIWIFVIGTFLAGLFFVEELITENEIIEKYGLYKTVALVLINSFLGGVVMVITYYGLVQFYPEWHEYLKVGLAGATSMIGKDVVHLYHRMVKRRMAKND